jgi:hypothetical protein
LGYHRQNIFTDVTSWNFGAQEKVYKYYDHSGYVIARVKDYEEDVSLVMEWMSLA